MKIVGTFLFCRSSGWLFRDRPAAIQVELPDLITENKLNKNTPVSLIRTFLWNTENLANRIWSYR